MNAPHTKKIAKITASTCRRIQGRFDAAKAKSPGTSQAVLNSCIIQK